MNANNVITPIQKVLLFQYNSKTPYEKFVYWVQYYVQWVYCWLICFIKKMDEYLEKKMENYLWAVQAREWLVEEGWVATMDKKRSKRPKAANELLEFIETQYDRWESRVEEKMKRDYRESYEHFEKIEGEHKKERWGNENIDERYYEKEEFENIYTGLILDTDNEEEQVWKRRVMIVHVPMIGNVMMYYDVFRMCFAYYSDTQGIHYNILNACAMRYVSMFRCMDLFMDEMIRLRFLSGGGGDGKEHWSSPLRWVNKTIEQFHLENGENEEKGGHRGIYGTSQKKKDEGKGIKLDKEERDKLFAKLKQYRTEYVPEKEIKLRNRFVYKGRTRDSYYHVFAKKVPEVKVAPAKVSLEMKHAFMSGLLPLKLPKLWEVEEQEILGGDENEQEEEVVSSSTTEKDVMSYSSYKKILEQQSKEK